MLDDELTYDLKLLPSGRYICLMTSSSLQRSYRGCSLSRVWDFFYCSCNNKFDLLFRGRTFDTTLNDFLNYLFIPSLFGRHVVFIVI